MTRAVDYDAVRLACDGDHTVKLNRQERERAVQELHERGYNAIRTAATLGIDRSTVYRIWRQFGLNAQPRRAEEDYVTGICEAAGISYRQLHYWCVQGYIPDAGPRLGTGNYREFTTRGTRRIHTIAHLTRAGLTVAAASRIAEDIEQTGAAELTEGITLRWHQGTESIEQDTAA